MVDHSRNRQPAVNIVPGWSYSQLYHRNLIQRLISKLRIELLILTHSYYEAKCQLSGIDLESGEWLVIPWSPRAPTNSAKNGHRNCGEKAYPTQQ